MAFTGGEALSDVPDLLNLVQAIEVSHQTHKAAGEDETNTDLDVASDCFPQFVALVKKVRQQAAD